MIVRYNEEKHGIEVLFDEKPDQATRDTLKAAGFRWYKPGGYWYAKQTEKTKAIAESLEKPFNQFFTTASDGYLGAIETTGSIYASGKRLYGADLSKAIRQALKQCGLTGCLVSVKTFSGGQKINVKVKAAAADLVPKDEFIKDFDLLRDGGYWVIGPDGKQLHRDFIDWNNSELIEATRKATAAARYDYIINEINGYGLSVRSDCKALAPAFAKKLDQIQRVLNAFNHDDSNAMVDYFDRHFYDNIRIIAA